MARWKIETRQYMVDELAPFSGRYPEYHVYTEAAIRIAGDPGFTFTIERREEYSQFDHPVLAKSGLGGNWVMSCSDNEKLMQVLADRPLRLLLSWPSVKLFELKRDEESYRVLATIREAEQGLQSFLGNFMDLYDLVEAGADRLTELGWVSRPPAN